MKGYFDYYIIGIMEVFFFAVYKICCVFGGLHIEPEEAVRHFIK